MVIVLGALSLIGRYRKASGVERGQLKWVALALVAALLGLVFMLVSELLGFEGDLVGLVPWLVAGLGFPIAVAIAILRYRLYDIDRLISRTVSYAIVAAVLVAVYAGFAVALGAVVGRRQSVGGGRCHAGGGSLVHPGSAQGPKLHRPSL